MFNELTINELMVVDGGSEIINTNINITLDLNKVIDSIGDAFNNVGKALHRAFGCPHCW